ncbi:MAG: hypothetical protein HZB53_16640 [Chloroflexi bacterium]|nr:hypothetical protein [Chloroflexota bacterium]
MNVGQRRKPLISCRVHNCKRRARLLAWLMAARRRMQHAEDREIVREWLDTIEASGTISLDDMEKELIAESLCRSRLACDDCLQ